MFTIITINHTTPSYHNNIIWTITTMSAAASKLWLRWSHIRTAIQLCSWMPGQHSISYMLRYTLHLMSLCHRRACMPRCPRLLLVLLAQPFHRRSESTFYSLHLFDAWCHFHLLSPTDMTRHFHSVHPGVHMWCNDLGNANISRPMYNN